MPDGYEIRLVKEWPSEELVDLYRAGGWWEDHYDADGLADLVAGSLLFAVAVESSTGRAVGMGRAISDGASDAWLQDIAVLPDHRGRGLGQAITGALLEGCLSKGLSWIGLVAEPGTKAFYERLGFGTLPGEPMVYKRRTDADGR